MYQHISLYSDFLSTGVSLLSNASAESRLVQVSVGSGHPRDTQMQVKLLATLDYMLQEEHFTASQSLNDSLLLSVSESANASLNLDQSKSM